MTHTATPDKQQPALPAKRAVVYLRVSTNAQADRDYNAEGFSIPAQREACLRAAERLDAMVVDEYVDRGESARSSARPALQSMLSRARLARDIDYVIVHKVDRLARSREDDVAIGLSLRQAGVVLVSATENIDETPSGKLMHGIMATIAEFYSANLATEARKGMRQKAKSGGTPGMAPFGYINVRDRTPEGREVRTVTVDPDRAPWVTWLYEQYATGEWTLATLREELNRQGVRALARPNRPPRPLANSHIETILKNRYYVGVVTFEGVEYPGRHKPLISEELWQRVQIVRQGRYQSREKPHRRPHYLKGSLFCGRCQEPLGIHVSTNHQGIKYAYLECLGRRVRKNGCTQRAILVEIAEREVERYWSHVTLTPQQVAGIRVRVRRHIGLMLSSREQHLRKAEKRVAELNDQRQKLLQAHYAEAIALDLLKSEQSRIATELAAAQSVVAEHEEDISSINDKLDHLLAIVDDAHATYQKAPASARRQLNQAIFERLYIDDGTVVGSDLTEPYLRLLSPDLSNALEAEAVGDKVAAIALLRDAAVEEARPPSEHSSLRCERPYGSLAWESENLGPCEVRGSNLNLLVGVIGRYSRRSDMLRILEKVGKQAHMVPVEHRGPVVYVPYRLNQRLDQATRTQLVRNYQDGIPTTRLTQMYGLSKASVLKLLREAGVTMRCQGLDEEQTAEAVRLYVSGLSLVRVGERVGFGPTSVAKALRCAGVSLRGRHDWRT